MTKTSMPTLGFANLLATEAGVTVAVAKSVLDALHPALISALRQNDMVTVRNFGAFTRTWRSDRQVINPKTQERLQIRGSNTVKFKPATPLKHAAALLPKRT